MESLADRAYTDWSKLDRKSLARRRTIRGGGVFELPFDIDEPTAILYRAVATPNYESQYFLRQSRKRGLRPIILENHADKFSVHNPFKKSLATQTILFGRNKHGKVLLRKRNVIEHNHADGHRFDELATNWGEPLVQYHHRKFDAILSATDRACIKSSQYVPAASAYYDLLCLFVDSKAVFVEDFITNQGEAEFFGRVVWPAFLRVVDETGKTPQVARLTPRRAASPFWFCHPAAMLN